MPGAHEHAGLKLPRPEPSKPEPSKPTNVGFCKKEEPWYRDFSTTISAFEGRLVEGWSKEEQEALEKDIKTLRDKLASCELIIGGQGITDRILAFNRLYDKLITWINSGNSTLGDYKLKKIIPPGKFKCDKEGFCKPSSDDDAVSKDECMRDCGKVKKSSVPTLDIFYSNGTLKGRAQLFKDIHNKYATDAKDDAITGWINYVKPTKKDVVKILKKFLKSQAWGINSPINNLGLANDSPEGSRLNSLI